MMSFNVFEADFQPLDTAVFNGARVEGRVLHWSPDERHVTVATRYPDGTTFSYGGDVDYQETFYVAHGTGSRTFADGSTVRMRIGDVIYVEPGVDIAYVYDPGFVDVAFFWSENGPLPSHLTDGLLPR